MRRALLLAAVLSGCGVKAPPRPPEGDKPDGAAGSATTTSTSTPPATPPATPPPTSTPTSTSTPPATSKP